MSISSWDELVIAVKNNNKDKILQNLSQCLTYRGKMEGWAGDTFTLLHIAAHYKRTAIAYMALSLAGAKPSSVSAMDEAIKQSWYPIICLLAPFESRKGSIKKQTLYELTAHASTSNGLFEFADVRKETITFCAAYSQQLEGSNDFVDATSIILNSTWADINSTWKNSAVTTAPCPTCGKYVLKSSLGLTHDYLCNLCKKKVCDKPTDYSETMRHCSGSCRSICGRNMITLTDFAKHIPGCIVCKKDVFTQRKFDELDAIDTLLFSRSYAVKSHNFSLELRPYNFTKCLLEKQANSGKPFGFFSIKNIGMTLSQYTRNEILNFACPSFIEVDKVFSEYSLSLKNYQWIIGMNASGMGDFLISEEIIDLINALIEKQNFFEYLINETTATQHSLIHSAVNAGIFYLMPFFIGMVNPNFIITEVIPGCFSCATYLTFLSMDMPLSLTSEAADLLARGSRQVTCNCCKGKANASFIGMFGGHNYICTVCNKRVCDINKNNYHECICKICGDHIPNSRRKALYHYIQCLKSITDIENRNRYIEISLTACKQSFENVIYYMIECVIRHNIANDQDQEANLFSKIDFEMVTTQFLTSLKTAKNLKIDEIIDPEIFTYSYDLSLEDFCLIIKNIGLSRRNKELTLNMSPLGVTKLEALSLELDGYKVPSSNASSSVLDEDQIKKIIEKYITEKTTLEELPVKEKLLSCYNQCKGCTFKGLTQSEVLRHLEFCPKEITKCKYSINGCTYNGFRDDVLEHEKQCSSFLSIIRCKYCNEPVAKLLNNGKYSDILSENTTVTTKKAIIEKHNLICKTAKQRIQCPFECCSLLKLPRYLMDEHLNSGCPEYKYYCKGNEQIVIQAKNFIKDVRNSIENTDENSEKKIITPLELFELCNNLNLQIFDEDKKIIISEYKIFNERAKVLGGCDFSLIRTETEDKDNLKNEIKLHEDKCPRVPCKCCYSYECGCEEVLPRYLLADHERECNFKPKICPNCKKFIQLESYESHLSGCFPANK